MAAYSSSTGDGWYKLAQLMNCGDQAQGQQNQQAMQMANPIFIYQPGSTVPYTTATQATLTTNFSGWQDFCNRAKLKFWRVNLVVEMNDGAEFTDPLDKLRVTVARWLRPTEQYNLT